MLEIINVCFTLESKFIKSQVRYIFKLFILFFNY